MQNPLVSILVPVYNVEKYIEQCARSLFEQDYKNIEFVFWDDCSTDDSICVLRRIIECYPHRKPQVFIGGNEHNVGLCETRKKTLAAMHGEYLWCVDSDDWIDKNACSILVETVCEKNADILFFDFMRENGNERWVESMSAPEKSDDFLLTMLRTIKNGNLANKFIRREFFLKNAQEVPREIVIGEDFSVMFHLLQGNPRLAYCSSALYHYRRNPDSITNQKNELFFERYICFTNYIESLLKDDKKKIAFAEFQAKLKLEILVSKSYPVDKAYKLFPVVNKFIKNLSIPLCYKLALKSFSGSCPYFGFWFIKIFFVLRRFSRG